MGEDKLMFIEAQKYKDIFDFVNSPIKKTKPVAGPNTKCLAIEKTLEIDENKCFSCLYCVIKDDIAKENYLNSDYLNSNFSKINDAFNGEIIPTIPAKLPILAKYATFESYTAINETQHISPWAAGILECTTSSKNNKIALEVNVPNTGYDRAGRLDVCASTEDYLLVFEAKISLHEALEDERFVEQFQKYITILDEAVEQKQLPYNLILLLGGAETDLLYPNHPSSSSNVGNESSRFYEIVTKYNIKFMSANALWLMALSNLKSGAYYSWDTFIREIFNDENCIGLVTAGKITNSNGQFNIESI